MNEHGRGLGRGQLDDIFGIAQEKGEVKAQVKGPGVLGLENDGSLRLEGKKLTLKVGDETIHATTGKPFARIGQVPLVIVNSFGEGKAVFLNLEVSGYAYDRLQADSPTSLPELMEGVFGLAKIEPQVRVLDVAGKRLPGTEIVRFANGGCEHLAIFRNPQRDDGGWGDLPTLPERGWAGEIDNSLLEKEAQVTITWPVALPTYDVRGKEDLGEVAKVQKVLDPWSPLVLTRSPQHLPQLRVEAPEQVRAGAQLAVALRDEAPGPAGSFRIVRLELVTPEGRPIGIYSRNVKVEATPHIERFALAYNDPEGKWQVNSLDLMTGRAVEAAFTVRS